MAGRQVDSMALRQHNIGIQQRVSKWTRLVIVMDVIASSSYSVFLARWTLCTYRHLLLLLCSHVLFIISFSLFLLLPLSHISTHIFLYNYLMLHPIPSPKVPPGVENSDLILTQCATCVICKMKRLYIYSSTVIILYFGIAFASLWLILCRPLSIFFVLERCFVWFCEYR